MSDDLLTTLVFKVKADGVETDISSMKRSLSSLGTHVKTITDATNKALSEVGTDAMPGTKGTEKASKAIIKQTGDLGKAIATFGSTASQELRIAYKNIESEEVRLRGNGIDPAIMNPYLAKLGEWQKLTAAVASQERTLAQEVAKGAALESQQIERTLELKRQIAGVNQTNATKRAAELKEELALTNQINEAALSKKYGGSAKPVAYYEEKAGASASSPAVSAALSNLKVQQDAARAEAAIVASAIADNAHYQGLKTQWAAHNKTLAEQEISSTKARAAALAAYYTEAQNAELNLIHTGRSKSAAMLTDKGQRLGFTDAEISAAVAGLKKVEVANAAAFAASNPHIDQLKKNAEAAGTSVKGLSASLRQVPAQFTDIIVSLQGGQAPLTVLLQQGGQLKDVFGGVGNASRALGGYVAGLITPFTIAATAVATLGIAYLKGAAEGEAYNKALILTGNAAGVTAGQLAEMAQSVAKTTGGTVGSSAEALAALAGTSNIASAQFEKVAATAVMMEKSTGTAVGETVKQFAELGKDPLQASLRLNESTHFLTLSVYEQIKALTDQGRTLEAGVVAQNAYHDVMKTRAPALLENLGYVEAVWKGIMGTAKGAWDAMLNVGRPADPTKQIVDALDGAKSKLAQLESLGQGNDNKIAIATVEKQIRQLEQKSILNSHEIRTKEILAELEAEGSKQAEEKAKWDEKGASFTTKQDKMTRELTAAAVQGQKMLIDGTITQIELEKRFANIREQYKPEKGQKPKVDQDYYATILKSISSFNEAALLELDTSHKLTESDKFRIKTLGDISAEMEKQIKLANGDTKKINTAIDGAVNAESLMHEAELLKAQVELRKGAADAAKAGLAAYKEINTEEAKRITALHAGQKTIEDFVIATNEASDAIKFESEVTGLSAENQKIAIEQYKVAIELRKELRKIELSTQFDGDETGAREKAKADMVAAYAVKSADATKRIQLDSQQKLVTQYSSIFQKGFVDMVNGGTDTWKSFTKSLVTTFKTSVADQIYKMFAQPFVMRIVGSLLGITGAGMSGVASASGISGSNGSEAINGLSVASNLNTLSTTMGAGFQALTGSIAGASTASLGYANAVGAVGGDSIGALAAANGNWAGVSTMSSSGTVGALGTAEGAGSGVASGLGTVGYAAGGVLIGSTIAGDKELFGMNGTVTSAIGAAAGAAWGSYFGPWGTLIGGIVGGVVNAAFGHSPKEMESSGVRGTLVNTGFEGQSYANMKEEGGWFSQTNHWTETRGVDAKFSSALDTAFAGTKIAIADLAVSLGLSTDKIAGYTKYIDIAAGTSNEAIQALFVGMGDEMSAQLLSGKAGQVGAFDAAYYMKQNPDVAASLLYGNNAQGHFNDYGRAEGRAQNAQSLTQTGKDYTYLQRDVKDEKTGVFTTETATQTLTRLSNSLQGANAWLAALDHSLIGVSLDGAEAASKLADLFGGDAKMAAANKAYYEQFWSDAERLADTTDNVTKGLALVGQAMPASKDAFRDVVSGLDLTTDAGRNTYAVMLALAPEFAQVADTATATTAALKDAAAAFAKANQEILKASLDSSSTAASDAMDALSRAVEADKASATNAYNLQSESIQSSIEKVSASVSKLQSLSISLKSTLDGMRISGSDSQYRADAQAQISAALATARSGGGLPLDGQLASALATVSKPSEQLYGNFVDYARDFYKTANDISSLGDLTGQQLTADQATQAILNAQLKAAETSHTASIAALDAILSNAQLQLDAANGINSSVMSVADALVAFGVSIGNLVTERTAQSLATSGAGAAAGYFANNADVKTAYADNSYGLTATEYASVHYGLYGASEGRASPVASTSGKSYFELYPDVAAAFAANSYGLSQTEYSARHFANFGKDEHRTYPGFAQGINNVPYDMDARIHEGEAVVPKQFNPFNPNAQRSDDTAAALLAMADRLDRIEANTRATAGHTAGTDRKLARVIPGNALITEASV